MRLFTCPACGGSLWFHNLSCACGVRVVYDPDAEGGAGAFLTLDLPAEGEAPAADPPAPCAHRERLGCNWRAEGGEFCRACAMTETAPDPSLPEAMTQWAEAEAAKRWVLANLGRWRWWTPDDPGPGPRFRMLAEETRHGPVDVIMGHADGVVTINLAEADRAERARRREDLGEAFRTLNGHFRHELAHALQLRLSASQEFLDAFRALFGDEREDYGAALARHYEEGPPADWQDRHVSEYASAHAHEDWAESCAHLLHLTDIVDSFVSAGLSVPAVAPGYDAYAERDAPALIDRGCELGLALNHVNRSMGLADLYPFVMPKPAREKLAFVHRWLAAGPQALADAARAAPAEPTEAPAEA
ncbi:putative zinc-binding metallopeptidase [Albimonas sp. CAU 1670]|uniref:zinc-binding metallopeptidase family protein n=1 Tax=Albimonas sp. CAU 1670 TaxID=3032599 RepID=UPI0023DCC99A|nr:putative zinc-binding metallopeptidase [Albimonas sp. CAU 1670]MDF2232813.1 putative zinc-binding metallopeptidase [Albimonas sp. CAU 1670]